MARLANQVDEKVSVFNANGYAKAIQPDFSNARKMTPFDLF